MKQEINKNDQKTMGCQKGYNKSGKQVGGNGDLGLNGARVLGVELRNLEPP